jgi:hypothetical protein
MGAIRMKVFKKQLVIAVLLVAQPIMARAESGFDFMDILQKIANMSTQSTILGDNSKKQLDVLAEQKQLLDDTQKLMKGNYGYGSKFDNSSLSTWQHAGKDWSSLLGSPQSGANDALTELAKQIEKEFPTISGDSMFTGSNHSEQAKLFDLLSKTTAASRVSSTLAYNNVDAELVMLDKLQSEIEKSPNQKSTLDLIARIQIEEAKLVAYQIKSNAVSAQLTSLQAQQEVSDAKWAKDFFKWH